MLVHQERRIDPAAGGLVGDSRPAGTLDAVVAVGCGRGYHSLGAGAGTDPVEGSPGVRRRGVLGYSRVAVDRMELGSVGGSLLVAEAGSSPAVVEDILLVLEADSRRTVGSGLGCSFAGNRLRRRRLRNTRCLTFRGRGR
jgi:hypothetical protein